MKKKQNNIKKSYIKYIILSVFTLFLFSSCIRSERYKVEDIKVICEEIVEREYKQSGKRILREQRRNTYTDTIRIYKVVFVKDTIRDVRIMEHKPYYNIGDSVTRCFMN